MLFLLGAVAGTALYRFWFPVGQVSAFQIRVAVRAGERAMNRAAKLLAVDEDGDCFAAPGSRHRPFAVTSKARGICIRLWLSGRPHGKARRDDRAHQAR